MRYVPLLALSLLAGCGSGNQTPATGNASNAVAGEAANDAASAPTDQSDAPLNPPAPGEPGGLPDDRTPVSEAPFTETSAQGAANVVQSYYALLEQGKYGEAWKLWSDAGRASGKTEEAFAAGFGGYDEYHANIGAPGRIEGAAGSLYVEVPVQVYGRLKGGAPFNRRGSMTLRRVNDVPGSTAEQRRWHIASESFDTQG
jgi:hypothetical protein